MGNPELQPGQGEPIPTDCSCGNPVGEVVQDGKTNFCDLPATKEDVSKRCAWL